MEDVDCDLLLFFATTSEKEELRSAARDLGIRFDRETHPRLGRLYRMGTVGDFRVVAVQTEMGPFSYNGSASKAIFFKLGTSATAIVQLGMAFGVDPDRQRCGDVLVSSSIIPYDRRKATAFKGTYQFDFSDARPHSAKASLLELFRKAAARPTLEYKVHIGAILSGGTAVYSRRFRDQLAGCFRNGSEPVVGGEMEGVGLLSVSAPNDPSWIVVKGISDFGEDERSVDFKRTRELACRNSAHFVLGALLQSMQV